LFPARVEFAPCRATRVKNNQNKLQRKVWQKQLKVVKSAKAINEGNFRGKRLTFLRVFLLPAKFHDEREHQVWQNHGLRVYEVIKE
jgi:hypothetical protein